MKLLYVFLLIMYAMILLGGAIAVMVFGRIAPPGHGDLLEIITHVARAAVAISLIVGWVYALSKVKNLLFKRQLGG